MKYLALATDYDGTIAHHGVVEPATVDALCELKGSGRKVFLVTGRELHDLFNVFSEVDIFDRVVAENGALLYDPETGEQRPLADPPPPAFADCLRKSGVKSLSVGRVIVATQEIYSATVHEAIHELGLSLEVILNKGAAMILPKGVDKATGLRAALEEFGWAPDVVVGVGDAENDAAFLEICGCGVTVANALPWLKERVHHTTHANHGAGVRELIRHILQTDQAEVTASVRAL
jgi:HAD superfamily hydrolase (TIGR01484 family)